MYTRLIQGYEAMTPELQDTSGSAARNLRLMMCGSSAFRQPVMQKWEAITGHCLLEWYGMTEVSGRQALSANHFLVCRSRFLQMKRVEETQLKWGSFALNALHCSRSIGNLLSSALGLNFVYIGFNFNMKKNPVSISIEMVTKESFTDDGYFKTGDAVKVDEDGYYIILGRSNADIMKIGGYKLSALEIESVILEHPVISECCVLGLPDRDYGEVVSAVIVPEEDAKRKRDDGLKSAMSLDELFSWAKDRLAPYKIPTQLFVWNSPSS
ncbi:malonate--CoA ligase-like [Quillaja saponaria]|uniref:Malonate--CoA ligase-like n=1 Tax=Quillaja saponaria TaxID=32244 RepID=A0AAD7L5N6_QUISA|nr:malonate--CoA ligase-like [Quillaja saponaria]